MNETNESTERDDPDREERDREERDREERGREELDADDLARDDEGSSRWRVLAPLLVLLLAAGAAYALFSAREAPPRETRSRPGPLVEAVTVEIGDVDLEITGHGEVTPRRSVDLLPQVPGEVVAVHPRLRSGGRFAAGETLIRIDPRDYELAVERAAAAVARARTQLESQEAEASAALAEWREIHGDAEPPDLVARGPQIRQARAELAAAEADRRGAELSLERTRLSVPFAGVVIEENVDLGQYLAAGRVVGRVYGTDAVEIRVPLPDGELAFFDAPRGAEAGPAARVEADVAGALRTWEGEVERLEGRVDPRSRMIHVVVRVDRPFAAEPPLLPGTFVDVAIDGRRLEGVARVPRHALREGSRVWIAEEAEDDDATHRVLRRRQVEVARAERDVAYVRGLDAGERVIVSSLDVATDGMKIRLAESGASSRGGSPRVGGSP